MKIKLFLLIGAIYCSGVVDAQTIPGAPAFQLPTTVVSQKWYGTSAPTSALGYPVQPGDLFYDTTNKKVYWCAAPVTATIPVSGGNPACTSVAAGGWTLITPTGGAPVNCGATCAPAVPGISLLNLAAGSTAMLPTSSGSGNVYQFIITTATTSAQEKILLNTVTDVIIGTAIGENAGTAKIFVGNAGTYHSIQMPFAGSQPSGGFVGDRITCTDIATGTYSCQIEYQAGTTPTTPYSSSTT